MRPLSLSAFILSVVLLLLSLGVAVNDRSHHDAAAQRAMDDEAGTFTMIYFDERDVSRRYTVEVGDGEVRWHRDEAGFAQLMVFTIAADGTRLDAHGTMSRDGGAWEDDLSLTYERIGAP